MKVNQQQMLLKFIIVGLLAITDISIYVFAIAGLILIAIDYKAKLPINTLVLILGDVMILKYHPPMYVAIIMFTALIVFFYLYGKNYKQK